jgi:hypothetical protein
MSSLSALLWAIAGILLAIWTIGLIAQATFGGLLHILLILIVFAVVVGIVRSRRTQEGSAK